MPEPGAGGAAGPPQVAILLVDDEQANLVALEAVLAPLGQRLVRAQSGRDALRHLLREDFAVILLDVRMAGMDGFETAQLIRSRTATQGIPIIFLTAFGEAEENIQQAYAIGAADFLFKPFVPDFLRAKVGVFVDLHQKQLAITDLLVEAQAASRSKSEFLNMAAHELRTPLSVVSGYLSMLGDGTFGEPPADWNRILEILNLKSGELNKIVDDLLTASRLETDSVPVAVGEVDLGRLVTEAADRLAGRAEMLKAEVAVELPSDPVLVDGDPTHLGRIIDNLLNNALSYTHRRPWVRLRVSQDKEALVAVEDHGIGIAEEMRERIFDRFVRLNDPELAPQPGTGLGLYISRELAQRHGGRLEVSSSEPGHGSTITLALPAVRAAGGRPAAERAAPGLTIT